MAATLTLAELAARCHHYGDGAARLFELSGHWSATADGHSERVVLARVCTHWSDHVTWWEQRRPAVALAPPSGVTVDLEEAERRVDVALDALRDEGPTPLGLRGLYELVAKLALELGQWADEHDADVDAPTQRVLDLVLADLRRDLADLETLTR